MHKLSHILKSLMVQAQITETELARRTNIGQPVIHRIASGETDNPKITTMAPIAAHFNITVSQLIGDHPLSNERQSAMNNPEIGSWRKVPELSWRQAPHWQSDMHNTQPLRYLGTDADCSESAFALTVQDASMAPLFQRGAIVIVDPARAHRSLDYVVVLKSGQQTPTLKQLIDDNPIRLKTHNEDINDDHLLEGDRILGVVLQMKISRPH